MVMYSPQRIDDVFAALADPTRRRVAERLSRGEMSLTELARPFAMTMPAVMKHLSILERSGVVRTEKRGRVRYCSLAPDRLDEARAWLERTARAWTANLASLDAYLKEDP